MKPTIKIADHSGFCYGVKRAIDIALETAQNEFGRVVTIGPIIHNPQMVEKLAERNVKCLSELVDVQDGDCVIVRSHGMVKEDLCYLQKRGVKIVDATCPNVAKIHKLVQESSQKKQDVIIFGDENHPEVVAIKSYAGEKSVVVKKIEDVPKSFLSSESVLLVSQTTQNKQKFSEFEQQLRDECENLEVVNTICNATEVRQSSTEKLAQEVDVMIVVGGLNSANTRTLAKIASKFSKTFHLETPEDLEATMVEGFGKIGLTAGASTPSWLIKSVLSKIEMLCSS